MTTAADTDRPMRALAETDYVTAMVAKTQARIVSPTKPRDALSKAGSVGIVLQHSANSVTIPSLFNTAS